MNNDYEKVTVKLLPHPNADSLSVVKVGDFQVVVKTADWKDGAEACYVYPDAMVDTNDPAFAFLGKGGTHRVRAIRLRGERSFGLLVPWRDGIGDNIGHWNPAEEPEPQRQRDPGLPGPTVPKYDLDNGRRYWRDAFTPGESVTVTEKLHGENARYVYTERFGFQAGSRSRWVPPESHWHTAAGDSIREFCMSNPGRILYGELYGKVGGFPYDATDGLRRFRAFDVYDMDEGTWLEWDRLVALTNRYGFDTVPLLVDAMPFDASAVAELAEGKSSLNPATIREGVVVEKAFRGAKMKWVSFGYLSA